MFLQPAQDSILLSTAVGRRFAKIRCGELQRSNCVAADRRLCVRNAPFQRNLATRPHESTGPFTVTVVAEAPAVAAEMTAVSTPLSAVDSMRIVNVAVVRLFLRLASHSRLSTGRLFPPETASAAVI